MSDRPICEYLQDAAQLIEDVGWCQGSIEKYDGEWRTRAFCLVGAIAAVTRTRFGDPSCSCLAAVSTQLRDEGERPSVAFWNDRPNRTAEEVTGLLWRAADRLKEAGR